VEVIKEILFVIVWLALCAAVGFYAEGKGRCGVGIFLLSLEATNSDKKTGPVEVPTPSSKAALSFLSVSGESAVTYRT
jgi:hypothetical protein